MHNYIFNIKSRRSFKMFLVSDAFYYNRLNEDLAHDKPLYHGDKGHGMPRIIPDKVVELWKTNNRSRQGQIAESLKRDMNGRGIPCNRGAISEKSPRAQY